MKQIINDTLEKYSNLILEAHNYIWENPETGFKEIKTTKYLEQQYKKLGYTLQNAGNIPGFYTVIDTGRVGPTVLVLGELDALVCCEHPECDKITGAVHCCGHSAQSASLLGVAAALTEKKILERLFGKIKLCAVPAEELIEIEYRLKLKDKGIIRHLSGKREFLSRGYFDDVDMAFMVHTSQSERFYVDCGSVGCVVKRVNYKGTASHSGASPWMGCNALYAATLGLCAINSVRETFKEEDVVRVHPIITNGGNAVNAIPDNVVVESFVRATAFEALKESNWKINRALCGAALSMGANVDIKDYLGYAPLHNNNKMADVCQEAAYECMPDYKFEKSNYVSSGSTDMGDLSGIMPVVHSYMPGAVGISHGANYYIKDPVLACVGSAKWQITMLYLLLKDEAHRANEILSEFKPKFASKKEYFEYITEFECDGPRIKYNVDKTANITLG